MEELKDILKKSYGINVLGLEKIKNVYKVKTPDGYSCFKASKYDIGQFGFIISAIQFLIDRGFNGVIPFYKTEEGDNFIRIDNKYGFLCDWIDSREANFKNILELKMCIDILGNLHIASRGFKYPEGVKGRSYYGKWIRKFKKRIDELLYFKALIRSKNKITGFDNMYLKYFDVHYKQGIKAVKNLEGSKYFEVMEKHRGLSEFCHHDSANHNFLITNDLNMFMIDFDYCIYDSHLHDLSSIIIRNLKYGNWNFDTMNYILDIYSDKIPINRDDLYLIFCFMEFPQDFWQVGLQYYVEKQPWGEEFFVKKLSKIVEDSRERMEFIREFEASLMGD